MEHELKTKKSIEEIFSELDFEMSLSTTEYCIHKTEIERKYKHPIEAYEAMKPTEQECVWCDGKAKDCKRYTE